MHFTLLKRRKSRKKGVIKEKSEKTRKKGRNLQTPSKKLLFIEINRQYLIHSNENAFENVAIVVPLYNSNSLGKTLF